MDNLNGNIKDDRGFSYTYSAKEQEELRKIREKYQPREESKIDILRRLDETVTKKAAMISIILGVVGALILGTGMSIMMTDIGEGMGLSAAAESIIGISVGSVGLICVSLAYPVYCRVLNKERKKIAPEVLKLTEELMK